MYTILSFIYISVTLYTVILKLFDYIKTNMVIIISNFM